MEVSIALGYNITGDLGKAGLTVGKEKMEQDELRVEGGQMGSKVCKQLFPEVWLEWEASVKTHVLLRWQNPPPRVREGVGVRGSADCSLLNFEGLFPQPPWGPSAPCCPSLQAAASVSLSRSSDRSIPSGNGVRSL